MSKNQENLIEKPPVVVILGHVDHGKTAILDYIRKTNVREKEAGGITQHIGAYEIEYEGKKITFIDTPGHEAFSAMRGRGARVADIAVLVVAATEGVKPQTKEAISYIKKAGIPMLVAINKIDLPSAQPEKVKQELSDCGVLVESLGGKIPSVNTSAKTGEGIDDLLEHILLLAELEQLKTDISAQAQGTIIESRLDAKKGPIATLLLNQGVLKENDILATPSTIGRIKSLTDFQGRIIQEAYPSQPVSVLGFEKPPRVGEKFKAYPSLEEAQRALEKKEPERTRVVEIKEGQKVLNIILKTDVLGSGEAIEGALENLPQEKVVLRILKTEVGDINVKDIKMAESGKAIIFGFRVKIDETAKKFAQQRKVKWKIFEVIYELIQEVRKKLAEVAGPEVVRVDLGKVKVLVLFRKDKEGQVVGGKVIEGAVEKDAQLEILREEEMVGGGKVKNLQQEKKDVQKVSKGKECGILFQGEGEIKEGDTLVVFREEKRKGEL